MAENIDAERERAAFEAWARPQAYWWNGQTYSDLHTQVAWEAWQAARRTSASIGEYGLPELPDARAIRAGDSFPKVYALAYTADQMREFARAAVAVYKRKHAALQEMVDIAQENDMGYGALQAAQGVKTWQERAAADGHQQPLSVYCRAEIEDLRAQLARQSQGKPVAAMTDKGRFVKWNPLYAQEPWVSSGYRPLVFADAAPPLSSEQQADTAPIGRAEVFRPHVGMIATDDDAGPYLKIRFRTMHEADAAFDWISASLSNSAPAQQPEKGESDAG